MIRHKNKDEGYINLKQMKPRDPFLNNKGNPHEGRFLMGPDLPNIVKKRSTTARFDNLRSRDNKLYQVNMTPSQAPESLHKPKIKTGIPFSK